MTLTIRITTLYRRHCEQHRTVLIGRSVIEPAPGIRVDQTIRIVVKPGPPSVAGPTSEVTTYLTGSGKVSVAIQELFENKFNLNSADFDFGAELWEKAIARNQDDIENLLVTESVGASY